MLTSCTRTHVDVMHTRIDVMHVHVISCDHIRFTYVLRTQPRCAYVGASARKFARESARRQRQLVPAAQAGASEGAGCRPRDGRAQLSVASPRVPCPAFGRAAPQLDRGPVSPIEKHDARMGSPASGHDERED